LPLLRPRPGAGRVRSAAALLACACALLVTGVAGARSDLESQLKSVASVELRGRRSVSARDIRAVLKTRRPSRLPWTEHAPLRYDFLSADRSAIELVYRQHGYLDVHVRDSVVQARDPNQVHVFFLIEEGRRSHVASVDFESASAVPHEALRHGLYARPNRAFNPAYLIADTAVIARHYGERGYVPHVVGAASRDPGDSLRIRVVYRVDEGPLYHVGRTYLATPGVVRVRERLLRRELLLKPGSVYRVSRVQESQERLYETGLFSEVQIAPLPDSTNTLMEFFVQVRERKPRWLDAGVGCGSEERLRFVGEWGHRNLTGHGQQALVGGRLALDKNAHFLLSRVETALLEPWLFGTRNRAQATIYYERRGDYRTDTLRIDKEGWGWSFQVRRNFGRFSYLSLVQDNTYVTRQDVEFLVELAPDLEQQLVTDFIRRYSTHRLQLAGTRDLRDNPLLTSRGQIQVASAEVAGGPFRGSTSFSKFQVSSSWFLPLRRPGWVLATRARGGLVKPFGERKDFIPAAGVDREVARVPTEDVFRLGGVNSIRGYDENEIAASGGLALLQGNLELRVPVAGLFGIELYVDAGNVWARPEYIRADDFTPRSTKAGHDPGQVRYVYGAGGRFNLPFGPLRFDYTWGLAGRHRAGRAQFAIGPAF